MNEQFLNDPADTAWLLETHLRGIAAPAFGSFVLTGNEDAPDKLALYAGNDPLYTDKPVAVFIMGENDKYQLEGA